MKALLTTGRAPYALRATFCIGATALLGWAFGDVSAGLLATLGAFTGLYGSGRPYWNRALVLAGIGLALTAAVSLGAWAHPLSWVTAPIVVAIAVLATFLCNALRTGPPGAYIVILVGAAGTALPSEHGPARIALLILAGAALAWCVHMCGALFNLRGPERAAVAAAEGAVARFRETPEGPGRAKARHAAAFALHDAWSALITFQPPGPAGPALTELRRRARELHRAFAEQVRAFEGQEAGVVPAAGSPAEVEDLFPLGRLEAARSLEDSFRLEAPAFQAAARLGLASAVTVALSLTFDFSRPYWAISAAAVVLHQGLAWAATIKRAADRIVGTLLGLGLAGIVLALHPQGLALPATLMALQFLIEMLIVRRYPLAVVFVTASALVIASGGQAAADVPALLWARGLDTVLGCGVGLAVYLLTGLHGQARGILREVARVEAAAARVEAQVAAGEVVSLAAREARRDLQHRLFVMAALYESGAGSAVPARREGAAAAVEAAERRGYRALADCWSLEFAGAA
jgi:uncharacterized membrane protein YccC